MNIEEDSLETKVCTSYDEQVRTVLLLSKAGYSQTNPDQTFIAEIANLNLQNVESYFISPIEFNFINIQELGQLISTVNKWHGIILTSIRCVDALIQSFNLLSEREIILAKWQQSTIFTVGDATKQYLLDKLHLDSIGHQSSNSETLAKFILDLNREQPIKLPLLYPCMVKFVAFGNVTAAKMTDLGIEVWFVSSEPKIKTLAREIEIRLIERLNE
ncbi:hypothetical protein BLOT_013361 [Blomia tropicalis]|nr:hypothetical protein BLOT_013361 [Blomia tropicalis]